jgi:hypothetical protein
LFARGRDGARSNAFGLSVPLRGSRSPPSELALGNRGVAELYWNDCLAKDRPYAPGDRSWAIHVVPRSTSGRGIALPAGRRSPRPGSKAWRGVVARWRASRCRPWPGDAGSPARVRSGPDIRWHEASRQAGCRAPLEPATRCTTATCRRQTPRRRCVGSVSATDLLASSRSLQTRSAKE